MGSLLSFLRWFPQRTASRYPYIRSAAGLAAVFFVCWFAGAGASAQDGPHVLTESGTNLGVQESAGTLSDLRLSVSTAGDEVTSTHVWAVLGGAELRQRTNNGYWVPWSGQEADLIDNRFAVVDGTIVFKLVDGSIAKDNQGITLLIGYRTGDTLKYGRLGIVPKGGS